MIRIKGSYRLHWMLCCTVALLYEKLGTLGAASVAVQGVFDAVLYMEYFIIIYINSTFHQKRPLFAVFFSCGKH